MCLWHHTLFLILWWDTRIVGTTVVENLWMWCQLILRFEALIYFIIIGVYIMKHEILNQAIPKRIIINFISYFEIVTENLI